jgi:hypothetical protein
LALLLDEPEANVFPAFDRAAFEGLLAIAITSSHERSESRTTDSQGSPHRLQRNPLASILGLGRTVRGQILSVFKGFERLHVVDTHDECD